eukprot:3512296-Prymnesium_polylepis.1
MAPSRHTSRHRTNHVYGGRLWAHTSHHGRSTRGVSTILRDSMPFLASQCCTIVTALSTENLNLKASTGTHMDGARRLHTHSCGG